MSDLLHATLVWLKRPRSFDWSADAARVSVREVGLRVGAGLRRWLLHRVSVSCGMSEW